MDKSLKQYISTLLQSDTGQVTETLHIKTLPSFRKWVTNNCHHNGMVNEQIMREFALSFTGLNKLRSFWVNRADYWELSSDVVNPDPSAYIDSKLIDEWVVMPDESVKRGEFWFVTNDEWMIIKYGR